MHLPYLQFSWVMRPSHRLCNAHLSTQVLIVRIVREYSLYQLPDMINVPKIVATICSAKEII